jgi:hypothetical protein
MNSHQFNLEEISLVPLVTGGPHSASSDPLRGDLLQGAALTVSVKLSQLSEGMSAFLAQMDSLLSSVRTTAGQFQLNEVEVSAGISASGEVTLFGIGGGEAGIKGGLKLTFRRV